MEDRELTQGAQTRSAPQGVRRSEGASTNRRPPGPALGGPSIDPALLLLADGGRVSAHVICRLSGIPTNAVEALGSGRLSRALGELAALEGALRRSRDPLSYALHRAIGTLTERSARSRLLKLRRDLFNGRDASPGDLALAFGLLPVDARAMLAEHQRQMMERRAARDRLIADHGEESRRGRAAFRDALGDEDFRKGLLLSSPTLFGNLEKYRAGRVEVIDARTAQVERGLLRYFSRAAMKATPFATFCAIVPGEWEAAALADGQPLLRLTESPTRRRSFIRLNKRICGHLWAALRQRPRVRDMIRVSVNPTLTVEAEHLRFLASVGGREVFQRLRRTEVLVAVLRLLKQRQRAPFGEVVAHIAGDPDVEASPEEARAYLDALLKVGLLRFVSVVHEQEADWEAPLAEFLRPIEDEHAQAVAAMLTRIGVARAGYADADVASRAVLRRDITRWIDETLVGLGLHALDPSALPFYEDAAAPTTLALSLPEMRGALDAMCTLVKHVQALAYPHGEMANMRHFFDQRYADRVTVPLLEFYEDYFREHLKEHQHRLTRRRRGDRSEDLAKLDLDNPFGLESVRRLRETAGALAGVVQRAWAAEPEAEEIRVPLDEVLKLLGPAPERSSARSASFFATAIAPRAGVPARLMVPAGGFHVGFGKYFSRFLYMLPQAMLDSVRQENADVADDLLAEIGGDAHFNANLHPAIAPWEISYPTGESPPGGRQLLCADLEVHRDLADPAALELRHVPDGRRVLPLDLGFLNPQMRPPLFQLLSTFMPARAYSLPIPETSAPRTGPGAAEQAAVTYRPRIAIGDHLVVARRRWSVAAGATPIAHPNESDAEFFLRANAWRIEHGIPEHVFVRVRPLPPPGQAPAVRTAAPDAGEGPIEPGAEEDARVSLDADEPTMTEPDEDVPPVGAGAPPGGEVAGVDAGPAAATSAKPAASNAGRARHSRDWNKPQFIDFSSPLLTRLFGQITRPLTHFVLQVEERYPTAGDLVSHGDHTFTTELVMQLTLPSTTPRPAGASGRDTATHG